MIRAKIGDRIELRRMPEDPDPIPVGTRGTVTFVNDVGEFVQYAVKWSNGRSLMLSCPPDEFIVLTD